MNLFRVPLLVVMTVGALRTHGDEPDWGQAERELTTCLWVSNTPMATLARAATRQAVTDGQSAMFKASVFLWAGMNEHAIAALHELRRACPMLSSPQISRIYYEACECQDAWDIAQAAVELFAENVTELPLENRLLKHGLESGRTVQQIDAWLAARPPGIGSFWIKERLRFAQTHGRGKALLEEWSARVRQDPTVTNALVFLDALLYARQGERPPDLSWFADAVKPTRALEAQALAQQLQQLEAWASAVAYYEQAIAIPVTEPEVRELGRLRQVFVPEDQLRAQVGADAREAMAECLLKLGQKEAAQQRLVEAADIREEHGLRRNALLAGQVQAQSGQRTIERRITEAETKSETDPEYWRERAQYFRGRQEPDREEEALKKGLALTKPQLRPEHSGKGFSDLRSLLLSDYARFLSRRGRESEGAALLRQELAAAPALAESTVRAAYLLAFEFSTCVGAEDALLWSWLAKRPVWGYTEERLLWRMLENAAGPAAGPSPTVSPAQGGRMAERVPNGKLEEAFAHAEKLAGSGDASRAYTLGWVMNRLRFPKRSTPLLRRAVETAKDKESKDRATFALLESLLDSGDWRAAEAVFPQASRQLNLREKPLWHSRLALSAAADGQKDDALRLWSRTANASPITLCGLEQLAKLGLRDDLITFYRAMQNEMPASHAPARAIKLLETN